MLKYTKVHWNTTKFTEIQKNTQRNIPGNQNILKYSKLVYQNTQEY